VQNVEHEANPSAQKKQIHYLGIVETCEMVAAPDKEKNPFSLRVNGGPDRDTMTPIKETLPGLVQYQRRALSFLAKVAHPEGSRDRPADAVPCPARLLPTRTGAVFLFC
jgi:hypothetical protein